VWFGAVNEFVREPFVVDKSSVEQKTIRNYHCSSDLLFNPMYHTQIEITQSNSTPKYSKHHVSPIKYIFAAPSVVKYI
jgi:hypothetical protein